MDLPPTLTIGSAGLKAAIARHGAELVRLQDEQGRDLLWNGDPAFWTGHAPLLFPIVGRLKGDHLSVDGVAYPMRQHGIARTSDFQVTRHEPDLCTLQLKSSPETRQAYPFDFELDVTYRVSEAALHIEVMVRNLGAAPMPAAMGFHPAFRWPLPYDGDKLAHAIRFERDEPEPIHQVTGGLLAPDTLPSPVRGRVLELTDELFTNDALIFLDPASRSVRYGPPGGRSLTVDFPLMPQLGIWSKPGAGFVCIEPWHGFASPADFDDDFVRKPGLASIPAGGEQSFGMAVRLDPP